MTFQELTYYLEDYACNIDPLHEDAHLASNCLNGHVCVVENLRRYSVPTLCHYFYELGIPSPLSMRAYCKRYREARDAWHLEWQIPLGEKVDS